MRKRTSVQTLVVVLSGVLLLLSACGRMEPPLPPEMFSPRAVKSLEAYATLDGVTFKWIAPDDDLQGEELESLHGYYIFRKEITKDSDVLNSEIEFEKLAVVEDTHIVIREEMREQARAEGKPARRIKAKPELKKFEYTDSTAKPGASYVYMIVPYNQDDVKGKVRQYVRVLFRGDASRLVIVDDPGIDPEF